MHPYIGFYDRHISSHLKGKSADVRRILEAMLAKGKTSFFIVVVGTLNLDQNDEPILPMPMLFDNLINAKGFDGKLIVADTNSADFKALAERTSDKTTIVQENLVSLLHSLASAGNAEIDLLYIGSSANEDHAGGVHGIKKMKAMPVLQDLLTDNTILVLDEKQKDSDIGHDIEAAASEYEKKPLVQNVLSGWIW